MPQPTDPRDRTQPTRSRRPPSTEEIVRRTREVIRTRNYSRRTAKAYVGWIVRFLQFNRERDPRELGEREISRFLTYLATGVC